MGSIASTIGILLVACGISPQDTVAFEQVGLVELNHFHDEQGRLVFDQVIFYDWSEPHGRYMVRAWRLVKTNSQLPQRNWRDGTYVSIWHDGDTLRKVRAETMRETWTQHDPELTEREYLPKEKRKDLLPAKVAKSSAK